VFWYFGESSSGKATTAKEWLGEPYDNVTYENPFWGWLDSSPSAIFEDLR
jgi:hypothetical protein